ncbi:MAG: VCBS repeat-containing protein [Reichenbachiella sp.]|uniref:VCBS repeat-containing protein n=1 Tax=Reichenbachiella sp. TaxID=2184521 RepID=UPI00296733D3|nr:VCBS repeat-containing protein [Reichenbachiella sp.]MDW3210507.1 VCBS repeat-containing protein [Reichenbachiella sp.]
MRINPILSFLIVSITLISGCNDTTTTLSPKEGGSSQLGLLSPSSTGIEFQNPIKENLYFNFINYSYIFNGGGVAAGDINNDGLIDLYFTANQQENKLYLNKGNLKFEDITSSANLSDKIGWSSGVTMLDVNNDGWLDIYVCKSGSLADKQLRANKLYINQKDNTFKEDARAWGLDFTGFSTQASFLDFDKDGDLDLFLVNHRADFDKNDEVIPIGDVAINKDFSNQLYRNDGDRFVLVTREAGLESMTWGLSAAIGDFNSDGWEDIYVCNDFLQPDFLYLNNQDGSFSNQYLESFDHMSQHSMGSDFGDINNDGLDDLMVLEMSPEDHVRSKENMPSMSTENFNILVKSGYHHQYMVNTLQVNEGNGRFSDYAQIAGVSKTDWSWAPLFADLDEDGFNDLLVTNGVMKDLANSDYRNKIMTRIASKVKMSLEEAQAMVPSNKLPNYVYQNQGNFKFKNKSKEWGFDTPTFSNGAVYADLDNDGDLDVVINNVNDIAHIYKNNSTNNSINIELEGPSSNILGIGARIELYANGNKQEKSLYLSRGYLSSVSPRVHFGLGTTDYVDSVKVKWPDGRVTKAEKLELNKIHQLKWTQSIEDSTAEAQLDPFLVEVESKDLGIEFKHDEEPFNDFSKQLLLPYKLSQQGVKPSIADVNGDGKEDFYIGSGANQSGELYIQTNKGFEKRTGPWKDNQSAEEVSSLFFDFDQDGDEDLYVVTGSYEFQEGTSLLRNHLYENDGNGNFSQNNEVLPQNASNGKVVACADIDADGDLDLFVGGRVISGSYPLSPDSYVLINENGKFRDMTKKVAPDVSSIGMVTGASFTDFDQDGDLDLMVVGEWSAIQLFENHSGLLSKHSSSSLDETIGLWSALEVVDIDQDGDDDYLVGNLGLNTKYKTGGEKEFHIFSHDFDNSGMYDIVLTNKYKGNLVPARGLECSSEQIPSIKTEFTSFQDFASASLEDIYGEQKLKQAHHIQVDILTSVLVVNDGNGQFSLIQLPNEAQIAPIQDFEILDVNKDGVDEIFIVGNLFETEVETVRYDAMKGVVLNYKDGNMINVAKSQSGFFVDGNTRSVNELIINDEQYLMVSLNGSGLKFFKTR